jgi:uncharacterized membrane protein YkvA (DUF1232 family)
MNQATIDDILNGAGEDDAAREERVRDRFWRTARRAARQVPFMEDAVASYYCALDRETPTRVRGTLMAALAYFVLPIDLVPDFVAAVGFTDDAAVLMTAITTVRHHIRPGHRKAARAALDEN